MSYNPHDDEDRPFAPNYRRGREGTTLRSAQNWDAIFVLLGITVVLPFLGFGIVMAPLPFKMCGGGFMDNCVPQSVNYIKIGFGMWIIVHVGLLFFAQRMVHRLGFRCPPAP